MIEVILLLLTVFVVTTILPTIIVNASQYKYYELIYSYLESNTFVRIPNNNSKCSDQIWASNWKEKSRPEFCFFVNNGIILYYDNRAKRTVALYNNTFTWFDPYTFYWYRKYLKYINKNILPVVKPV